MVFNIRQCCKTGSGAARAFIFTIKGKGPQKGSQQEDRMPADAGMGRAVAAMQPEALGVVPPLIFTYWTGSPTPALVLACLGLMRKNNPGWQVRLVQEGDQDLIPPPGNPSADESRTQHTADWYKTLLLGRHGGVWLDATAIPTKPVTSWVSMDSHAVQGWAFEQAQEAIENWALAAPAAHPLVLKWHSAFREALTVGPEVYCARLNQSGLLGLAGSSKRWKKHLPYLVQHAAFVKARQGFDESSVALRSTVEPGAPFAHLKAAGWDPEKATHDLFNATEAELNWPALVKLRGLDRPYLPVTEEGYRKSWLGRVLISGLEKPEFLWAP